MLMRVAIGLLTLTVVMQVLTLAESVSNHVP